MDWCGLPECLVLFRLVVPPVQPGVVESYLVRGARFPSHLLLMGTDCIQIFWAVTGGDVYVNTENL
jgi:hypothetical protein